MSKRIILFLLAIIMLFAASLEAYYYFVYLPEQERRLLEERIKPLMDAGLTREEAKEFDRIYSSWATNNQYNRSVVGYAAELKEHPLTAKSLFLLTDSVDQTASSLDNLKTLFVDKILTDEKASKFILSYPQLVKDDGINATDTKLLQYHLQFPGLTDTVIKIIPEQNKRLNILLTLQPPIVEGVIPEEGASDFMMKHPELALDDGINPTDLRFMEAYISLPGIVDKIIEKVRPEHRLFALDELTPYITKPLTEEQAHHLIEKWYPELFEGCEEKGVPVVFGDLDEDKLNHHEEIFELGTDPFKANDWIKFVFDFTRRPSDYWGSSDTRDLAAAFDRIQFLDRNSSVLDAIEFGWGDEKYLKKGWYPIEYLIGKAWAGKNATIILDDSDTLDKAHFLRIIAGSVGKTNYQEEDAEFKDLMNDSQEIQVYFNGNLTDKIRLHPRMQISYINLKPGVDSDNDGMIDKLDPNPRIPEPKLVKGDVNVSIYYVVSWRQPPYQKPSDWEIGTSYHSLLGFYDCNDPDVVDWHIKWAVEHGVSTFIIPNTMHDIDAITLENGLLRANYLPYINFAMMFDGGPWWPGNPFGNDPSKLDEITNEAITYYAKNYFDHPNYVKINGSRPLLMFGGAGSFRYKFGLEKYYSYIDFIRNIGKEHDHNIFLVGHVVGDAWRFPGGEDWQEELSKPFDAISAYTMNDAGVGWKYDEEGNVHLIEPYDSMVDGFIAIAESVSEKAKKFGVGFIPLVQAGFDNSVRYDKGVDNWLVIRTDPSPEKFKVICEGVKPYIDPNLNIVIVEAWNEFHEGSVIEPTEEFDFGYLNAIRDVFCGEISEDK